MMPRQEDDTPCVDVVPRQDDDTPCVDVVPRQDDDTPCVDVAPPFSKSDRLLESELRTLDCYNQYEVAALLNNFLDHTLNGHLYLIFKLVKTNLWNL